MNFKKLYSLAGILALLAIVTYFFKNANDAPDTDNRVGQPIATVDLLAQAKSMDLVSPTKTLHLAAAPEHEAWTLKERFGLPVSMDKLGQLVSTITDTRIERLVGTNPERIAELGFSGNRIVFKDESGKTLLALEIGRESDSGKQLVKFADEDMAFLASGPIRLDFGETAWIDKKLPSFPRDEARSLSLELADGESLSVSRSDKDSAWTTDQVVPKGLQLDQGAITRLVNRFTNLTFQEVAASESADVVEALNQSHQFEIGLENGKSFQYTVGRRPEVKVEKEVEVEGENGETTTETQEEVETPAGPVYLTVTSSDSSDFVNSFNGKVAYEIGSYHFDGLPKSLDELYQAKPEPASLEGSTPDSNSEPTPAE